MSLQASIQSQENSDKWMLEARHLLPICLHLSLSFFKSSFCWGQHFYLKLTVNRVWIELMSEFQLGKLNEMKHEFRTLAICGITKLLIIWPLQGVTCLDAFKSLLAHSTGVYLLTVWGCCRPLVVGTCTQVGFKLISDIYKWISYKFVRDFVL